MDPFKTIYFDAAQENQRRFNQNVVRESTAQSSEPRTSRPSMASMLQRVVTSAVAWPLQLMRQTASHGATVSAKIPGFHFFG